VIAKEVKANVNVLSPVKGHIVLSQLNGGRIVTEDDSWGARGVRRNTKFFQEHAKPKNFLGSNSKSHVLGFSGRERSHSLAL